MHTVYSDGDVWPTPRVQEARKDGLEAIAITGHGDYHPKKGDVSEDISRPYEIARLAGRQLGTLVAPAAGITRGNLHCNALFVKDANAFKGLELAAALRQARDQGAFVFWNHQQPAPDRIVGSPRIREYSTESNKRAGYTETRPRVRSAYLTDSSGTPRPALRLCLALSTRRRKRGSFSNLYSNQSSSDWKPIRIPAGLPWRVITTCSSSAMCK